MENPALGGASCQLGGDRQHPTRPTDNLQVTLERAFRHEWRAEWLGSILALRLDQPRLLVLGAGTLHGLEPELAEELAETFLADCRAGQPIPPFNGLRAEARKWAALASRAELRAYLGACWNRLGEADRAGFLQFVRAA